MEAKKSQDLQSANWRLKRADGIVKSVAGLRSRKANISGKKKMMSYIEGSQEEIITSYLGKGQAFV